MHMCSQSGPPVRRDTSALLPDCLSPPGLSQLCYGNVLPVNTVYFIARGHGSHLYTLIQNSLSWRELVKRSADISVLRLVRFEDFTAVTMNNGVF
jgi:hypothetical protein